MTRRKCPAAIAIMAELAVDLAQRRYDKTKSRRAWFDLERARREALSAPSCNREVK